MVSCWKTAVFVSDICPPTEPSDRQGGGSEVMSYPPGPRGTQQGNIIFAWSDCQINSVPAASLAVWKGRQHLSILILTAWEKLERRVRSREMIMMSRVWAMWWSIQEYLVAQLGLIETVFALIILFFSPLISLQTLFSFSSYCFTAL